MRRGNAVRSRVLATVLGLTLSVPFAGVAAQGSAAGNYPDRPVRVVTPWADGFPANSVRIYAERLSERLKHAFVVDTRSGAGGEVAAKVVVPATGDGYTLLGTGSSIVIRTVVDPKNVDPVKELQPIAQLVTTPYVIVSKAGRYADIAGFLQAARAPGARMNFASAGVGTGMHFLGEMINSNAGIRMVHVPYPTGSRQLHGLLSGDVEVAIISLVTAWPQIKAGALDALVVSSGKRSALLPKVPTLAEAGISGIPSIGAWIAMFGPKHLEPAALKVLTEQIQAISADPELVRTVQGWGAEIPDTSLKALEEVIAAETESWRKLVKEKNLGATQ